MKKLVVPVIISAFSQLPAQFVQRTAIDSAPLVINGESHIRVVWSDLTTTLFSDSGPALCGICSPMVSIVNTVPGLSVSSMLLNPPPANQGSCKFGWLSIGHAVILACLPFTTCEPGARVSFTCTIPGGSVTLFQGSSTIPIVVTQGSSQIVTLNSWQDCGDPATVTTFTSPSGGTVVVSQYCLPCPVAPV